MKSRYMVMGVFGVWFMLILWIFFTYSMNYDPFFNTTRNMIYRHQTRGSVLDRHGSILVKGSGTSRKYLLGPAGGSIIGFARPDIGVEGYIERQYGEQLISNKRSKFWYFLNQCDEGYELKTTLDKNLQRKAYEAMGENKGAIVVMKLNGEILASVSTPSYDPNSIEQNWKMLKIAKDSPLFNKALSGTFPPGSVWKVIDTIELLDHPDIPFTCTGSVKVGDKLFRCSHTHGRVRGIRDAFARSCNGYFITRGLAEVKAEDFLKTSKIFMNLKDPDKMGKKDKDYAFALVGQGSILFSPMEGARLAATIGNRGLRPEPAFLKSEIRMTKVITEEKAKQLQSLMKEAVEKGTGRGMLDFVKQGYLIGLKTGTAEKDLHGGKKTNVASIVGFAGRKAPEIAFSIVIENTEKKAAEVCLPALKQILAAYFAGDQKR